MTFSAEKLGAVCALLDERDNATVAVDMAVHEVCGVRFASLTALEQNRLRWLYVARRAIAAAGQA